MVQNQICLNLNHPILTKSQNSQSLLCTLRQ